MRRCSVSESMRLQQTADTEESAHSFQVTDVQPRKWKRRESCCCTGHKGVQDYALVKSNCANNQPRDGVVWQQQRLPQQRRTAYFLLTMGDGIL